MSDDTSSQYTSIDEDSESITSSDSKSLTSNDSHSKIKERDNNESKLDETDESKNDINDSMNNIDENENEHESENNENNSQEAVKIPNLQRSLRPNKGQRKFLEVNFDDKIYRTRNNKNMMNIITGIIFKQMSAHEGLAKYG